MKRSKFSEEPIIGILKEHQAGLGAAQLCRKHGVSEPTFYKWQSKYGGLEGEPWSAIGPRTMASAVNWP